MNKFESLPVKQESGQSHEVGTENNQRHEIGEVDEQLRLLKDQINHQDSEKIDSLRLEIASYDSNLSGKFNPQEVFASGRERFASYLEKVSLRTLVGYIEKSGTKIKNINELSLTDKKALTLLKKQEKSVLLVNPRLYFLSKADVASLATQELLKRLQSDEDFNQRKDISSNLKSKN